MTNSLKKKLAVTSVFPSVHTNQAKSRNGTVWRRPFGDGRFGDKSVNKTWHFWWGCFLCRLLFKNVWVWL